MTNAMEGLKLLASLAKEWACDDRPANESVRPVVFAGDLQRFREAYEALSALPGEGELAPKGWRAVPTEPTEAMIHAGRDGYDRALHVPLAGPIEHAYRSMLSTAPSPPARETVPEPEFIDHRVVDLGAGEIGAHSVGGFGVPHDGCECGTCQDARTGGPETAPSARETAPSVAEALEEIRDGVYSGRLCAHDAADIARTALSNRPATGYERCASCNGSGLELNMAGEPDECHECKGNTVVPATGASHEQD